MVYHFFSSVAVINESDWLVTPVEMQMFGRCYGKCTRLLGSARFAIYKHTRRTKGTVRVWTSTWSKGVAVGGFATGASESWTRKAINEVNCHGMARSWQRNDADDINDFLGKKVEVDYLTKNHGELFRLYDPSLGEFTVWLWTCECDDLTNVEMTVRLAPFPWLQRPYIRIKESKVFADSLTRLPEWCCGECGFAVWFQCCCRLLDLP